MSWQEYAGWAAVFAIAAIALRRPPEQLTFDVEDIVNLSRYKTTGTDGNRAPFRYDPEGKHSLDAIDRSQAARCLEALGLGKGSESARFQLPECELRRALGFF